MTVACVGTPPESNSLGGILHGAAEGQGGVGWMTETLGNDGGPQGHHRRG